MHSGKTFRQIYIIILTFVSILSAFPQKGFSAWEKTDDLIDTVAVTCLSASANGLVAAGTGDGRVFVSEDNGTTWNLVDSLMIRPRKINAVFTRNDTIVVGTSNLRAYILTKQLDTWTSPSNVAGVESTCINAFCAAGERLYIATAGGLSVVTSALYSADSVHTGHRSLSVAVSGDTLYEGTDSLGVFVSYDKGATWAPKNSGFEILNRSVKSLAAINGNLYAAVTGDARGTDENTLRVTHVYTLRNQDTSWLPVDAGFDDFSSMISAGSSLLAATSKGIFRSDDSGMHWNPLSTSLPVHDAIALTILGNGHLLAGGIISGGVFRSADRGSTWLYSGTGLTSKDVLSLCIYRNHIFAGTRTSIFSSADNGTTWNCKNASLSDVAALAATDSFLIAGTALGWGSSCLYVSRDTGTTWTLPLTGYPKSSKITSLVTSGKYALAGMYGFEGIYQSDDAGLRWGNRYNSGLIVYHGTGKSYNVYVLALGILGSAIVASTTDSLYYTRDFGTQWNASQTRLSSHPGVFTSNGRFLFAGSADSGVLKSADSGKTWILVTAGLTNNHVHSLCAFGNNVFAGTDNGEVYLTSDEGNQWSSIGSVPAGTMVQSLITKGDTLYCGVKANGVWRLPLDGIAPVTSQHMSMSPASYLRTFFRGSTLVAVADDAASASQQIALFTASGRCISTIHGITSAVNPRETSFPFGRYGSGLFFVKFISNGRNAAQFLSHQVVFYLR